MENISVHFISMPPKVNGLTVLNEDDSYTIFLDANASRHQQEETYLHEMSHIENNDFYKEEDVQTIEAKRHRVN